MSFLKRVFIFPIRLYQWLLSPLLGQNCRFQPTCSQYMVQAIEEWGPFKGILLGIKRIGKCHPWGPHGHDPVPENPNKKNHYPS
jgi:putative membrane protein insertion efficiency factor